MNSGTSVNIVHDVFWTT